MMTTFDQSYKTVRRLGEGGFGVVYLVKRKVDGQVRSNSRPQQENAINDVESIQETQTPLESLILPHCLILAFIHRCSLRSLSS
jgi:serine/threonine protein kinase